LVGVTSVVVVGWLAQALQASNAANASILEDNRMTKLHPMTASGSLLGGVMRYATGNEERSLRKAVMRKAHSS
jgi:hypothetical protein